MHSVFLFLFFHTQQHTSMIAVSSGNNLRLHGARLGVLALVLALGLGAALGPAVEDGLPVLVELQLDDGHLGGVDADVDGGAVDLLALDALDVDAELLAVALDDLADLLALVVAADNLDLIVLEQSYKLASFHKAYKSGKRTRASSYVDRFVI